MNPIVRNYLKREKIAVLSGIMPDGGSHSSTVHFSHQDEPFVLIFQTSNSTMKFKSLNEGKDHRASVVIGFDLSEFKTLQMRGELRLLIDEDEIETAKIIHINKHPEAKNRLGDDTVFLEFKPKWWRYSDMQEKPPKFIQS